MKPLIWGLLTLLTLVLQATVVPLMAIGGIRPDLLLIIVVSSALLQGKEQGVGLGFFAGLLQDLASGNIFGLNSLSKLATGYLAGSMERNVFKENVLLPVLAIIMFTLFNSILMLLILFMLGYYVELIPGLVNIFYFMVYNATVAVPVHQLIYRITRHWAAD